MPSHFEKSFVAPRAVRVRESFRCGRLAAVLLAQCQVEFVLFHNSLSVRERTILRLPS
jgi:hypothetical protein